MYCESCGARISDNAAHCAACGAPVSGPKPIMLEKSYGSTDGYERDVPDYMGRAIVATILFFWPLGIPAIINAVESKTRMNDNDYMGALESAERAKMWANTAIGVGIGVISLVVVVFFFIGIADSF